MKNDEFSNLLSQFGLQFSLLSSSTNLKQVKTAYEELELRRDEIIEWVSKNSTTPEESTEYFLRFGEYEDDLWYDYQKSEFIGGIPSFDPNLTIDQLYDMFDEHSSYFMRYGCINSDHIISWDERYVLIEDELDNVVRVKRPDVLLSGDVEDDDFDDETDEDRQKREEGFC
jgi:hypothetical protein